MKTCNPIFNQPLWGMGRYVGTYGQHTLNDRPYSETKCLWDKVNCVGGKNMELDELAHVINRDIILVSGGLPSEV